MKAKNKLVIVVAMLLFSIATFAQELNCTVDITAQKLTSTDPKIFQTLKGQIYDYMNLHKWTSDVFGPSEKIDCRIAINITDELGSDYYKGTIHVQSSRPVFSSSMSTVLLDYIDKDFVIQYVEYQPLEFNENAFSNNLVSILAFYAYTIIGLDYDSFSPSGGTPYFLKAQTVMNTVPANLGDKGPGWRPFDGTRNRYWMNENILNPNYVAAREASYLYHRQGLDLMYDNIKTGRPNVFNALKKMENIVKNYPSTMIMQMFFDIKRDEMIKMFMKAQPNDKGNMYQLLVEMDPTKVEQYAALQKN